MKRLLAILLCTLSLTASPVHADDPDGEASVSVSASGRYIGSSDFDDSSGGVQVTSGQLEIEAWGFSFSYTGDKYSWNDKQALPFGNGSDNPWDTLHLLSLGYEFDGDINKNWGYSMDLELSSAFENEMSDSYGAALTGGFSYEFNDNWSTRFGGRISGNSIDTEITPYLTVSYENFAKDGSGAFFTLGAPSSEAGYAFNKASRIRASLDMFEGETYRLKDDSSVARKGYVETSSMLVGLYYDWQATDSFFLSFGPEYHFGREMQLYDSDGDKLNDSHDLDSALGCSLDLRYTF